MVSVPAASCNSYRAWQENFPTQPFDPRSLSSRGSQEDHTPGVASADVPVPFLPQSLGPRIFVALSLWNTVVIRLPVGMWLANKRF